MPETIEQALARTLAAAATVAPQPADTFAATVAARRKRRPRRIAAVIAAVAVVFSMPVVATVMSPADRVDRDGPAPATPGPPIDLAAARPVHEVWPDAIVRLPVTLPDGRPYMVLTRIDDGRYVVAPQNATPTISGPPPLLFAPDTREVTELVSGGDTVVWMEEYVVGETHVLWAMLHRPPAEGADIWSLSRRTGVATRLASVTFPESEHWAGLTPFQVGDAVYLSAAVLPSRWTSPMRVYSIVDGTLKHVPEADGWELAGAGWLMLRPDFPLVRASTTPGPPSPTPPPATPTWWNIATGQRFTPNLPQGLECSGLWCHTPRGGDQLDFYRFDGSLAVSARGPAVIPTTSRDDYYAVVTAGATNSGQFYLLDLRRGVAGRFSSDRQPQRYRTVAAVWILQQTPNEKVIIDFSLIDR